MPKRRSSSRFFYRHLQDEKLIKRLEQTLLNNAENDFSSTTKPSSSKHRPQHENTKQAREVNDFSSTKSMRKALRRKERLLRADKAREENENLSAALIKNIDDCKQLSTITRSSLGPYGTHKLVFKLFLNELVVQYPAAKLLVLAAKQQHKNFGDGTNLVVSIAGQHLEGAKELLITMGLNPTQIINGYKKASNKVGEILEALVQEGSETMDVRNKDQVILRMKAPVYSVLCMMDHILCPFIAEACIQVCPKNPANFNVDNVRVTWLLGVSLYASKTFRGMVLEVDTVVGSIKAIHDAKVLVVAGGVGVDTTESEQLEEAKFEEVIKASGAKVIVSGAGVGQKALQFCDDNKIMVLQIASKSELDCFCRTTEAVALLELGSTVESVDPYLGYVHSILVEKTRGDRVTVTNKQGAVATLLLGAAHIIDREPFERAVVKGVYTYKALCRDSRIVPGAGATEFEIARQLRLFARKETGSDANAIEKYADSFELIPKTLAQNAYLDVEDIIENLKADHEAGNVEVGIDTDIWDLYTTKYQALEYAADAVCNALSVVNQDREPQSMFDRLMAEHHVSGQSLGQLLELPPRDLLSIFYESIWINNLQPKREVEMLAFKIHGDKLFELSPDGRLSSFDIRSGEVCWSIPTDIGKSSESDCSYFLDSSRVFIHTKETKPVGFEYKKFEVCEESFSYFDEEVTPSRSVTQMYFDAENGCRITPLMSYCDEILIIRTVQGQLTSCVKRTNNVLWYERVATFYMWIVGREEGVEFQEEEEQLHQSFQVHSFRSW